MSFCIYLTWEQDSCRDALQDSAHGLPWTEWRTYSAADHLLHQQLHRLVTEKQTNLSTLLKCHKLFLLFCNKIG